MSRTCSDCTASRKDYQVELCALHAAAPELLASAIKALRYFESYQTGEGDTKRNLRQAIAHAKGRGGVT